MLRLSKPLILYHADCADGFCAAWVAHRKFGDDADYLPVQYGQEPPVVDGREVFILDFSYKRLVLNQMVGKARTLVLCDHHKTAAAELAEFYPTNSATIDTITRNQGDVYCVFDMAKSGGRLAWDFFFPGQRSSWLVNYTEDRDLWRWQLPNSREVSAALASYPKEFSAWEDIDARGMIGNQPPQSLVAEGRAILRYQQQLIDSICKNAVEIEMDGHKVLSTNATLLISEVGNQLSRERPFSATFFIRSDDGKKVWSLRSQADGLDVSEIAKRYGGGGHRNAAGFTE